MKHAHEFGRYDYKKFGDEISFDQYIRWEEYFSLRVTDHDPEHYYLANIACMLSMDKKAKLKDFLIGFETKPAKRSAEELAAVMKARFGNKEKN